MAMWKQKLATVMLISGDRLTVVQGNELRVDFFNSSLIKWTNEDEARVDLLKLLPNVRRRRMGDFCLVLPRVMFFAKQLRLPSVDEEELRKMVSLQISQHLPYPAEQAVWDFVVSQQHGSSSDILLLSIQSENIRKYLRVMSAAGLNPSLVTISSNAAAALLQSLDLTAQKVLFLPEEGYSEFCFCTSDNNFYASRGIVYGHRDFQTEKIKDFFAQARLTFETHRKNFPQNAVTTGYYFQGFAKEFPEHFWEALSQESGVIWKELSVEHLLRPFAAGRSQSLSVSSGDMVAGLALLRLGFANVCNFLPGEYKARNSVKSTRRNITTIAFLIVGAVISITLAVMAPVIKKLEYAKKLDEQLRLVERPFLKSRKELALWTAITQSLNQRASPLKLIEELYDSAPQGVAFSRIQVNALNELQLEGQAMQSSAVNDLQGKMIASAFFRDVRLERSTRRIGPLGELVYFIISAKLYNVPSAPAEAGGSQ